VRHSASGAFKRRIAAALAGATPASALSSSTDGATLPHVKAEPGTGHTASAVSAEAVESVLITQLRKLLLGSIAEREQYHEDESEEEELDGTHEPSHELHNNNVFAMHDDSKADTDVKTNEDNNLGVGSSIANSASTRNAAAHGSATVKHEHQQHPHSSAAGSASAAAAEGDGVEDGMSVESVVAARTGAARRTAVKQESAAPNHGSGSTAEARVNYGDHVDETHVDSTGDVDSDGEGDWGEGDYYYYYEGEEADGYGEGEDGDTGYWEGDANNDVGN